MAIFILGIFIAGALGQILSMAKKKSLLEIIGYYIASISIGVSEGCGWIDRPTRRSWDHRQEEEHDENDEMHGPLEHGGAAPDQGHRGKEETQCQQGDFFGWQAQGERELESNGSHGYSRDRQANGREGGAQREIKADLHPVAQGGPDGGRSFGQQHKQGDGNADNFLGHSGRLDHTFDTWSQHLGQTNHGDK